MTDILERWGLSMEVLIALSYRSQLGIRLKKNLHYFDKQALFDELCEINEWYDRCEILHTLSVDYRIKNIQSACLKYERYYPDHQTAKVFNDMLGFRVICDSYEEVFQLMSYDNIRIANLKNGKAIDDGYRGVHIYFQLDNFHYPIEIQYNTAVDRQFNNWLHKYIYKKEYDNSIGCILHKLYTNGKIRTEQEFKEVLNRVLLDCKKNE